MLAILSTPEDRIREKASPEFNMHPAARPTSPKIGAHTGFMRRLTCLRFLATLGQPMAPMTGICTASYNNGTISFKNCENAFFLASTIFGGRDAIEEFVVADVWLLSDGWKPTNIVFLDVDWAMQQVSFP
jgi:hypothetical protein